MSSPKGNVEKGLEIGRQLAKTMLRNNLDVDDDVFEALYAEYDSRSEALLRELHEALDVVNLASSPDELMEELGAELALLGSGADDIERRLSVYRIQELAAMKTPTKAKIKALWRNGYDGDDFLISTLMNGGDLQRAFEDVTSYARQTPASYPTNMAFAFRHFITTAEACLPKKYIESDDDLDSFYTMHLLAGKVSTVFPARMDNVAPIQELMVYQGIAKYAERFADGFSLSKRSGLSLLCLNFAEKAIMCEYDMIARTRAAIKDHENSDGKMGVAAHVRKRMMNPTG